MKLWIILILSLFFGPLAFADTGGYTVEPHAPQGGLIDSKEDFNDSSKKSGIFTWRNCQCYWNQPVYCNLAYENTGKIRNY